MVDRKTNVYIKVTLMTMALVCLISLAGCSNEDNHPILENGSPSDTVATFGDREILKEDVALTQYYDEFQDDKTAIVAIVRKMLLEDIAQVEGIEVLEDDIDNYISEVQILINDNNSINNSFNKYLRRIGKEEDEFWKDSYIYERYRFALIMSKYKHKIIEEIISENMSMEFEEAYDLADIIISEKLDVKMEGHTIEYIY